jgi:hypothetical protein
MLNFSNMSLEEYMTNILINFSEYNFFLKFTNRNTSAKKGIIERKEDKKNEKR